MFNRLISQISAASALVVVLGFGFSPFTLAKGNEEAEIKISKEAQNEVYERDVDEVAHSAQLKAISKLTVLLNKYRNARQEPILLAKLAELQQQNAAIVSRIAHGSAAHSRKAINLTSYFKAMKQAIDTLNTLIAKYPHYEEIGRAYFMRGKGYEEIENKKAAAKDYLYLVKNFPEAEELTSAYMSLAEFAIDENDYPRAVNYLLEVEKRPDDQRYPFALYKLAWCYYNLKNIPTSLSYAERQIAFYNNKAKTMEGDATISSDNAFKENMLSDVTTFFLEGYEEKLSQYQLADALPYFRKLENGPFLGKMIMRFGKLLRSHDHEADLYTWKDEIISSEFKRPESLEVVLVTYEYQLNKRRYLKLTETSQDIVRLFERNKTFDGFPRAQKLLLDTADGLQKLLVKNKDSSETAQYSNTLATIYDSFTKLVDDSDPRIPRVHYNLAETLFAIKDYLGATDHYRWVVDHGRWKSRSDIKKGDIASVVDASLKAIASRYEVLRQRNLIPKEVSAQSISKNTTKDIDPFLSIWIQWLDTHLKHEKIGTETFVYEANRALYAQGHILESLDRLKNFSQTYPKSQYAIPSASLIIDTYIASTDWEKAHDVATDFMETKEWKNTDFSKRLFVVASDSAYKIIENKHRTKDLTGTLKAADDFLKNYKTSARFADCLSLAGATALELQDKKRAFEYFSRLIKEAGNSEGIATALLARASLEEERYHFTSAALDYKAFLALPTRQLKLEEGKMDAIRRKTITLSWLSGDSSDLRTTLNTKSVCNESLATECEKYSILMMLTAGESTHEKETTSDAFNKSRSDEAPNRALWAALALQSAKSLGWKDRMTAIKTLAGNWDNLDPLIKFTLVPYISDSIPKAFRMNRMDMREIAPLRADERYITHRVDVIRAMEKTATKVMDLPWSRIRAEILNEVAALYLDLSRGLTTIAPPKNLNPAELAAYEETIRRLVMPFEEKGQDMRSKAFEIASGFGIEENSFNLVAEPFFADNPSQAKALKPLVQIDRPKDLSIDFLAAVDFDGGWQAIKKGKVNDSDDAAMNVKALWAAALKAKNWPQVAYFLQESKEKKLLPGAKFGLVKAVSLAASGARGEALAELEDTQSNLEPKAKTTVLMTLVQYSMQACGREKTKSLLKEIQTNQLNGEQASLVAHATNYVSPASSERGDRAPASKVSR